MNQEDKRRALETAVASIEKDYGKGSIMRLGDNTAMNIETIPTGSISLDGKEVSKLPAHKIVELGIVQCPEGRRIFPDLTVDENLAAGAYLRKNKDEIARDREWVYNLFPRLSERTWQLGATLSGGEQQMLAVARSLMSKPKLLMLDEPSLGLAPLVIKDIFSVIQKIKEDGVNILLIEQNAKAALDISDYAYVMETGVITMAGPGKALLADPRVKQAYLGE